MKYLVIDACLGGTGIRDYYKGGYINPDSLGLSDEITDKLSKWVKEYENEHYDGFTNEENISRLDLQGREIAVMIKKELASVKVSYFSDAKMIKEII